MKTRKEKRKCEWVTLKIIVAKEDLTKKVEL